MTAYRYFQRDEATRWWPIEDGADVEKRAIEQGAKKLTVLALNVALLEEEQDRDGILYSGPLYFDLDYKEGLDVVIDAARELCIKLEELQVPPNAIEVYLSGSKGIHVLVPAKVFSNGRPRKDLPKIYQRMAYHLHVRGMDFQVYAGGRGNSFRIANVQRYDGNYRVPISREELAVITPEQYREMVKAPRPAPKRDTEFGSTPPATSLKSLMEKCEKELARKLPVVEIEDKEIDKIRGTVPACISDLADYKVRSDANFNQAAFQLGVFVGRVQPGEQEEKSLVSRLAAKGRSSQYDSERRRFGHVLGAVRYAKVQSKYKFSCRAMRELLITKPCEGCALEKVVSNEGDGLSRSLGVYENEDGTWMKGEDADRQVLSFGMTATDVFCEWSQSGKLKRRVGAMVDIVVNGQRSYGSIMLPETAWGSKASFISAVQGLRGVAFLGSSDIDVQKLKLHVFRHEDTMGEIVAVHTAGIMFERSPELEKGYYMVYVEPGYSFDQFGVAGTHHLASKIQAPPHIAHAGVAKPGDDALRHALSNLLEINDPRIVAEIIGWMMACHLKAHIHKAFKQFPVLSVWGSAEAGKTQTVALATCLNGCDYLATDSPLNVSNAKEFSILSYFSATTTVPRIMEEFNKPLMKHDLYNKVTELLKSAYNELSWSRGTVNRSKVDGPSRVSGASTTEIPVSCPIVTVSEQPPVTPSVVQRSIQVLLSKDTRRGREEPFFAAKRARQHLHKIARAAVMLAMRTDVEYVQRLVEANAQYIPDRLTDRPRFNYQAVLAGLDFLRLLCSDAHLNLDLEDKILSIKSALIDHLNMRIEDIVKSKERSEVDLVMEAIIHMISRGQATGDIRDSDLIRGAHWDMDAVKGQFYLHVSVVHSLYRMYSRRVGDTVIMENVRTFETLLRHESYYIDDKMLVGQKFNNRPVWGFDIAEMKKKGLPIDMVT